MAVTFKKLFVSSVHVNADSNVAGNNCVSFTYTMKTTIAYDIHHMAQ
jgi:hypothetical protein